MKKINEFIMELIEDSFKREGYISIPFSFNGAGHPIIQATMAGNVPLNILLDTGASANLLDYEFAKNLQLTLSATGEKGGGAGGMTYDVFIIEPISLYIHGQEFRFDNFLAMDFSSIKDSLISSGVEANFQGILGFGFFKMTKCFIDYHGDRLFVNKQY